MKCGGQVVGVLIGSGLVDYVLEGALACILEGFPAGALGVVFNGVIRVALNDVLGGVPPLVLVVFWTRLDLSLIHHIERPAVVMTIDDETFVNRNQ